jgi:hypothetical protein
VTIISGGALWWSYYNIPGFLRIFSVSPSKSFSYNRLNSAQSQMTVERCGTLASAITTGSYSDGLGFDLQYIIKHHYNRALKPEL